MIETAILSRLVNHAGVSGLVSDRVWWQMMPPETTESAIVFERISSTTEETLNPADGGDSAESSRYQFKCYSGSDDSALPEHAAAIREEVHSALIRWNGGESGETIIDSILSTKSDGYDPQSGRYVMTIDFLITYYR